MKYIHLFLLLTLAVLQTSCGSGASDGDDENNSVPIPTTISEAVNVGAVGILSEQQLFKATVDAIDDIKTHLLADKYKILNLNADGTEKSDGSSLTSISWHAVHSALIESDFDKSSGILYVNADPKSTDVPEIKEIASIGKVANGRFMVMGGNPMRTHKRFPTEMNEQMHRFMENSLAWLTKRDDLKQKPFNVVIAQLDKDYYAPDRSSVRLWLTEKYNGQAKFNDSQTCDSTKLSGCLTAKTDLLIISQHINDGDNEDAIIASINKALQQGIGVLFMSRTDIKNNYTHKLLLNTFGVKYYASNRYETKDFNPVDVITKAPAEYARIKTMFMHFINKDYQIDWASCAEEDNCKYTEVNLKEFLDTANIVKKIADKLDTAKISIFEVKGSKIYKLLILSADKIRESVKFPMQITVTNDTQFLKAIYADRVIHNYRKINPAQKDLGNFGSSDFSKIKPKSKVVKLTSRKSFRSTGAYAFPGKSVKVTRIDDSDVRVRVFFNTIRTGATHEFKNSERNNFSRPKYVQTPKIELIKGETITLTSPYGGPVQLAFDKNNLAIEVKFENIGEHPYWKSSADDASFSLKLEQGDYNWAEISTPGFEVHSRRDKMLQSIEKNAVYGWGTLALLAQATKKYMFNYPHVLAGFKGDGVDAVPEIVDFASTHDLEIAEISSVKHMNADQASCGGGCSGNPYDAYWAFSPLGHGDIHELGHGLERSRFRFTGWEGHSTTNAYSYYSKSKYFMNTGNESNCQTQRFEDLFDILKASIGKTGDERVKYINDNFFIGSYKPQQLPILEGMMHAQKMGKLENGWHLLARLHILDRVLRKNWTASEWESKKSDLGFDSYTLEEIRAIPNNDWILISMSFAVSLDYRDFLTLLGQELSDKAKAQVASFNYPKVPEKVFVSTPTGYCASDDYGTLLDKTLIDISPTSTWPITP